MKTAPLFTVFLLALLAGPAWLTGSAAAQSVDFTTPPPTSIVTGQMVTLGADFDYPTAGTLKVQLFRSFGGGWQNIDQASTPVSAGNNQQHNLNICVPAGTTPGGGYLWMVQIHNASGGNKAETFQYNVNLTAGPAVSFTQPAPTSVTAGSTYTIKTAVDYQTTGLVKAVLFDSGWNTVDEQSVTIYAGSNQLHNLDVTVPANAASGGGYLWMIQVHNGNGGLKNEKFVYGVTVNGGGTPPPPNNSGQFLPTLASGSWDLNPDWADEFTGNGINGTGEPANWFPHLGSSGSSYDSKTEKGLRWTNAPDYNDEDSAWMFSTKFGNTLSDGQGTYWLDGSSEGHLVLRAAVDQRDTLNNATYPNAGDKVEVAYLQTGRPVDPNSVSGYTLPQYSNGNGGSYTLDPWAGKFVEPGTDGIYLSCRAKINKLGHSTWFAFWAHTHSQAYENKTVNALNNPNQSVFNSGTGTEIDIVEVWGSQQSYTLNAFSNNNHWKDDGNGSVGVRYDSGGTSTTQPIPAGIQVEDGNWHEYGVHWMPNELVYYVDGTETYRTTSNVPDSPRDMMILLTLEFQVDKWEGNQGDGRTSGSSGYYTEQNGLRVLSHVEVDWVRVHKMQ